MDSRRPCIITTNNGTQWKVLERLEQDNFQTEQKTSTISPSTPSHATLKLRCVRFPGNEASTSESFMRVYMQIPHILTETEDSASRAAQANLMFRPAELDAYSDLSRDPTVSKFTPKLLGKKLSVQSSSGFVPGGLPRRSRSKKRSAFEKTFMEMSSTVGIWPEPTAGYHLVWDENRGILFWVGFRKFSRMKGKTWTKAWLPCWDLVETPGNSWAQVDWERDTTGWKY
ncbi:hypothetical protein N7450_010533 [Penicillium hetheringtonii]|uniref:Uncharacterized protein n=1 Tax=Penicillium hetheringtonii TaxID=911720 RepID=A0AAD6D854_9EURO|nr:hypothetical protein N7450_010533 [Penicillium hetheringtonii]